MLDVNLKPEDVGVSFLNRFGTCIIIGYEPKDFFPFKVRCCSNHEYPVDRYGQAPEVMSKGFSLIKRKGDK